MTVLFVVTSLMGAGHLVRTLTLARAVREAGGRAVVVSGGRSMPHISNKGIDLIQLPPLWSDGLDYSRLLSTDGPAGPALMAARTRILLEVFEALSPDVVVTELWPFGRRMLSAEFEALAKRAAGKARIFASIRDVLEPKKKPERAEETAARLAQWYDGVLVHGDPSVIRLEATWPGAAALGDLVRYTGYVAAPPPTPLEEGRGDVLVSVGGGMIGRRLLDAAIGAAARQETARIWRLRVGGADAGAEVLRLTALAGDAPVIVEAAGQDYRARLGAAACSLSLLGYNTATDILSAGVPAVIMPMTEGQEQEQRIRAAAFARLPGMTQVREATPAILLSAVQSAIDLPGPPPGLVDLAGARNTAAILLSP